MIKIVIIILVFYINCSIALGQTYSLQQCIDSVNFQKTVFFENKILSNNFQLPELNKNKTYFFNFSKNKTHKQAHHLYKKIQFKKREQLLKDNWDLYQCSVFKYYLCKDFIDSTMSIRIETELKIDSNYLEDIKTKYVLSRFDSIETMMNTIEQDIFIALENIARYSGIENEFLPDSSEYKIVELGAFSKITDCNKIAQYIIINHQVLSNNQENFKTIVNELSHESESIVCKMNQQFYNLKHFYQYTLPIIDMQEQFETNNNFDSYLKILLLKINYINTIRQYNQLAFQLELINY